MYNSPRGLWLTLGLVCFFSQVSLAQIEDYFRSGKAQIQKNNYEEAIQDFSEVIRLKDNYAEAYFYRATAFMATKNYEKASNDLNKAIELTPKEARYYAQRGQLLLEKKFYTQAIKDLDKAIDLQKDNRSFYVLRANAFRRTEQYASALEDCQQALKLYPSDDQALYEKACTQLALQNEELALQAIEQALLLQSKKADYYLLKGQILQQKGLLSQAIEYYSKTLNYNPASAAAHYRKGQAELLQGEVLAALKDLDKAILLDPSISNYYHQRADLYEQMSDFHQAIKEYDKILAIEPNNVYAITEQAQIYLRLNQYPTAITLCDKALATNPYFQEPLVIRGIAKFQTGKVQDANEDFYTYLRTAVSGRDYFFIARQMHDHLQDREFLEKAEQWIFKAIQKEDIYVHNHLYASILYKLGKNLNSLEVANKAISLAKKEGQNYTATQKILNAVNQSTVDDIPPVITLASPTVVRGGVVVSSENEIHIIGKASDESGVKEVLINGNPAKLLANGDFEGVLLYKKEMKYFTIEATDTKGNLSKTPFQVIREEKVTASNKKYESLGTCYALIFATDEYEYWNNLVNPVNDAKTIAKDLEQIYGFEIDLVTNPTQHQVILKLKEYLKKQYKPNDQLLIFFAGHGQFDETFKEGYVVAQDSKLDDATKVSYLPHAVLRTYINNIACKHVLLMMDVCFGGTFDPLLAIKGIRGDDQEKSDDITTDEFIRRKLATRTRKYITSGGKEYVPDGTPGNHSPFARRFLEALRSYGGKDNILTLSEVVSFVEMITPEPHAGEFGSNEPGSDFIFVVR